jgi:acetoin utilization protein AcuB
MLRVRDAMTQNVATVSSETTLGEAYDILQERRIRHLPVVRGRDLIGVVSDRDIRDALPESGSAERGAALKEKTVVGIVHRDPITAHPLDTIDHASSQLYERKIGCMPVVAEGELAGIITSSDMMRTLTELTGAHEPGSWVEVEVPNRPGMLASVAEVVQNRHVNIAGIFLTPAKRASYRVIVLRLETTDPSSIAGILEEAGYSVYSLESTAPVRTTFEES